MRLLLEAGALRGETRDNGGMTPLELAFDNGHHEVVDLLEVAAQKRRKVAT